MNALPQTTMRRLKKIPQTPTIWEGDRRPLSGGASEGEINEEENRECIIWVDAVEGLVRAMDIVPAEMGLEAIVRTFLRAIENPHNPAQPARPQKIVVQNREIQFFLRGALQNLEISVDYVPELPLIDELFRTFEVVDKENENTISTQYENLLEKIGYELWRTAPWNLLADHDIVALEINRWDIDKLYACVMGMLGKKYGVILYRSLDSMRQFRSAVLSEDSVGQLESAFLGQDCWFLSYELKPNHLSIEDNDDLDLAEVPATAIFPVYGSVHPLEGIRPIQEEEEAMAIYLGLKALLQFCKTSRNKLNKEKVELLKKRHRVTIPLGEEQKEIVSVNVSTMPEVTNELIEMLENAELEEIKRQKEEKFPINEDLIPEEAIYNLDVLPRELVEQYKQRSQTYVQGLPIDQLDDYPEKDIPVLLIQTSRPKAQAMIEKINDAGGLQGICFTKGEDSWAEITYELAIALTNQGELYLIGEFIDNDNDNDLENVLDLDDLEDDNNFSQSLMEWYEEVDIHGGYCNLLIAMGIKGATAGNPQAKDILGLFEIKLLDPQELGLGVLELNFDFVFEEE